MPVTTDEALGKLSAATWRHKPDKAVVSADSVAVTTTTTGDLWQRTYYGFRFDNAPALGWTTRANFTLTLRTTFVGRSRFDQCGVLVHVTESCWAKASIEHEDGVVARLGSVVTNAGFSDWATTDVKGDVTEAWWRLSRRGPDFLVETSWDGTTWAQQRIFHLLELGDTVAPHADPPAPCSDSMAPAFGGMYVASPVKAGYTCTFDSITWQPCLWKGHSQP